VPGKRIAIDLANVFDKRGKGAKCIATLAWGDAVEVVDERADGLTIAFTRLRRVDGVVRIEETEAFIKRPSSSSGLDVSDIAVEEDTDDDGVLRVDFVDVQQGDGAIIETPSGRVILIDGGDNQLFARYLAARFRDTNDDTPKEVDCIVVTHGDADHFLGLTEIHRSEGLKEPSKRLFIHPARVYHNGLVKRASKLGGKTTPEKELLGPTRKGSDDRLVVTGIVDDPRDVDRDEMNRPFQQWCAALDAWQERGDIELRRLDSTVDGAFDFLADEDVTVEVLGPMLTPAGSKRGLTFLGTPIPKIAREPGEDAVRFTGHSASHTINGHSVILRLTFGAFRFLFAGDLNEEAEDTLRTQHEGGAIDLTAEVFKVPHHGSADYSAEFIKAVSPVISVVSSGDEQERKEFIHPRATLMGTLGRFGRAAVDEPLVFVTELAAFFRMEGVARLTNAKAAEARRKRDGSDTFFAFSRSAFGMVKVRTDGKRLLVYTYSGKDDLKEAYAFRVDGNRIVADVVRKT